LEKIKGIRNPKRQMTHEAEEEGTARKIDEIAQNAVPIVVVEETVATAGVIRVIADVTVPSRGLVTVVVALVLEIEEIAKQKDPRIENVRVMKIPQNGKQLNVSVKLMT
jgi:hypothetical protein